MHDINVIPSIEEASFLTTIYGLYTMVYIYLYNAHSYTVENGVISVHVVLVRLQLREEVHCTKLHP